MMERFEALNSSGYTVLMGAETAPGDEPAVVEAAAPRVSGFDYGRFDDIADTDSDDDGPARPALVPPGLGADAIADLGDETQALWDVIYNKIAKGDLAEAQRLMKHPEEIEDHPLIKCLYGPVKS